jgi:hypothetical protein
VSKSKLIGSVLAFFGGFSTTLAVVASDGIVPAELIQAAAAGFTTALAYVKTPAK